MYTQIDINNAAGRNLRGLSVEEAWETIKDCAQCDKQWKNLTSIICDQTIANLKDQLVGNDVVRVKIPSYMSWLDAYEEPLGDLDMMEDKMENQSPQSTLHVLPLFEFLVLMSQRNDILMFQQHQGESLSEAWTRFKDLLQKVTHHGIDHWLLIQIFYDHVSFHLKCEIDCAAGGKLRDKNADESWEIIENLTLYDHGRWNDSNDFVKPVKAISTSQGTSKMPDRRLLKLEDQINFLLKGPRPTSRPSSTHVLQAYVEAVSSTPYP
ncbi:hypothetical protein Tco_1310261 [Tanacetum coccineum]